MSSLKVVQYVVIRRDLIDTLKWPVGAVIAQACHACIAVIQLSKDDEHTKLYLEDLDNMHKVILQVYRLLYYCSLNFKFILKPLLLFVRTGDKLLFIYSYR